MVLNGGGGGWKEDRRRGGGCEQWSIPTHTQTHRHSGGQHRNGSHLEAEGEGSLSSFMHIFLSSFGGRWVCLPDQYWYD